MERRNTRTSATSRSSSVASRNQDAPAAEPQAPTTVKRKASKAAITQRPARPVEQPVEQPIDPPAPTTQQTAQSTSQPIDQPTRAQPEPEATPIAVPTLNPHLNTSNIDMSLRKPFDASNLGRKESSSFSAPQPLFGRSNQPPLFSRPSETSPFGQPTKSTSIDQSAATALKELELLKMKVQVLEERVKTREAQKEAAESRSKMDNARAERHKKSYTDTAQTVLHLQEEIAQLRAAAEETIGEPLEQPEAPEPEPQAQASRPQRTQALPEEDRYEDTEPARTFGTSTYRRNNFYGGPQSAPR
ncbi:hypothetical protein N8T08_002594 [Aspergillus melleus]|uniref:Uncharacterized protein n=1 Tax=Aspergillus melleus TaxID=138277 RepID=A0ACC3B9M6_9EURO|nr:hypothetical protein N8T08_002594 [Aspergillus melleus]